MIEEELQAWNAALEGKSPQEILAWAAERFGTELIHACSFGGASGMAILDMLQKIAPQTEVFYLDTGFLFPETLATRDAAVTRYGIRPLRMAPLTEPSEPKLWETEPDRCCAIRKVEPNRRALAGKRAWIAGLRRDQSKTRETVLPISWDAQFELFKIAPLYAWTEKQVWAYLLENNVPYNPLHDQGYASIGCTHCTRAINVGEELRDGRWSGTGKIECGLHR